MRRKPIAAVALLLAVCLLAGCASKDYKNAKELYSNGEYKQAMELFTSLGDYEDAAELAVDCQYRLGKAAQRRGDYEEALEIYEALKEYKLSGLEERINACRYLLANEAEEKGSYKEAAELYGEVEDYRDAAERITACEYQLAVEELEAGNYSAAAEGFETLGSFGDSEQYLREALSALAREAFAAREWDTLRELLNKTVYIPEEGGCSAEEMLCVADAYAAYETGDFAAAVTLLENSPLRDEIDFYPEAVQRVFEEDYAAAVEALNADATAEAVLSYLSRGGEARAAEEKLKNLFDMLSQGDSYPAFPYMDAVLEQLQGSINTDPLVSIVDSANENRVFCYLRYGTWKRTDGASMKGAILQLQDGETEPLGVLIDVTNIPSKLFFAGDVKWKTIRVTGRDTFTFEDYMVNYSGNTILATQYLDCEITIDYEKGILTVITVEKVSTNGAVQHWKLIPPEE